ncbi:hypothetical protein JNG39_09410 [Luteibacter sp. CQ10]
MTLAEHDAQLKAEGKWDEYQAMRARREEEMKQKQAAFALAEAPLVQALRDAGVEVDSAWDLVKTRDPYPKAIPVLLEHLGKPYPERVIEGILRSLAVPEARHAWQQLRDFFEAAPSQMTGGLRWAAGIALNGASDDSLLDDMADILRDPRFGHERQALLSALARSGHAKAKMLLHELRDDPVLGKEIKKMRRMARKVSQARRP